MKYRIKEKFRDLPKQRPTGKYKKFGQFGEAKQLKAHTIYKYENNKYVFKTIESENNNIIINAIDIKYLKFKQRTNPRLKAVFLNKDFTHAFIYDGQAPLRIISRRDPDDKENVIYYYCFSKSDMQKINI